MEALCFICCLLSHLDLPLDWPTQVFLHLFIPLNLKYSIIRWVPFPIAAVFKPCSGFQPVGCERFTRAIKKPKKLWA